jgi:uncharacterized lipoprotein NlpE involved in copper resistance
MEAKIQYVLTGTSAADTITGGALADTITGGAGGDSINMGAGANTYDFVTGSSIVYSATSDANTAYAAGETITFATTSAGNVDTITGFVAGAGGDMISTGLTAAMATSGLAATLTSNADSVADKTYYLSGAYVAATGVFTIAADGAGADTLVWANLDAANDTKATVDTWIVLVGVDSSDLVAANFIA